VLVCLTSLAAGTLGGVLGMASGIFIVPALTLIFGIDIRQAVGAGLISVIACSCGSAASAMENRLTNVRLAILLEIGTTLGALTGVALGGIFPSSVLYLLFAAILLLSAHQMFRKRMAPSSAKDFAIPQDRWADGLRFNSSYPEPMTKEEIAYRVTRVWLGMILMYAAGAVSALLGIGGGRAEGSRDGFGAAAADQGLLGDLQLHDRRHGGGERGHLLRPGRGRPQGRGPRRPGFDMRCLPGDENPHADVE
jgi:uncharacterized protein